MHFFSSGASTAHFVGLGMWPQEVPFVLRLPSYLGDQGTQHISSTYKLRALMARDRVAPPGLEESRAGTSSWGSLSKVES